MHNENSIPCTGFLFALAFSRLEKGPNLLFLSPIIEKWLLNPSTRFEPTSSSPDTFLTKIYDKTRVNMRTKAKFRFFLVDFVPFLRFRIGVGHVVVTIKKLRYWLPVLLFVFS